MMLLAERIDLMGRLGAYFEENPPAWQEQKLAAERQNGWFTQPSISLAIDSIRKHFLQRDLLESWLQPYQTEFSERRGPEVGVVMAGNIPLVGFHDFLSVFLAGCRLKIKLSSKDTVLWQHIIDKLYEWAPGLRSKIILAEMLKGCDAYIATGSNNSARYFEYYFQNVPHIIRKNRTSVAVLSGRETAVDLAGLADDVCSYFGLGCRNVTRIFVPEGYDFEPLLQTLDRYAFQMEHHKYRNNYDYQLALYLLNKIPYMSSKNMLLVPSESNYAPVSVLHYSHYRDSKECDALVHAAPEELQCIVDGREIKFGTSQQPALDNYADGVDTLAFLARLKKEQKTSY